MTLGELRELARTLLIHHWNEYCDRLKHVPHPTFELDQQERQKALDRMIHSLAEKLAPDLPDEDPFDSPPDGFNSLEELALSMATQEVQDATGSISLLDAPAEWITDEGRTIVESWRATLGR